MHPHWRYAISTINLLDPVVDREMIVIEYQNFDNQLHGDLKATGSRGKFSVSA